MTDPELTAAVELGCQRAYEEIGIAHLQHSPLPWGWWQPEMTGASNPDGATFISGPAYVVRDKSVGFKREDAVFICRACNSFDALLEVCEEVECGLQFFVETRGDVDGQLQNLLVRLADVSEKARSKR